MQNPARDEASAFRVVLVTLGDAVLVVLGAWIATWLGVIVFLVLVAAALWAVRGGSAPASTAGAPSSGGRTAPHSRRCERDGRRGELRSLLERKADGVAEDVLIVCPALNSKVRTWTSDEDGARAAAQARLDTSLAHLAELGVRGGARSGTAIPSRHSRTRSGVPGRRTVVSTHPPGRSHWLELGVVESARMRYDVPVHARGRRPRADDSLRDSAAASVISTSGSPAGDARRRPWI